MTAESCRGICRPMEKRWGLDLDMSAVRLMRRDEGIWSEIAAEKIDGADIEDRLVAMIGQIEPGHPVELFLPRDQILYTDVDLGPVGDTPAQIERAMDGRTPYPLDELVLDWEMASSGSARVAAIARETLEEAAAFAEVRGLGVSGYSSLASEADFPRLPVFDGPRVPIAKVAAEDAEEPVAEPVTPEPVEFTSARKPSRPPHAPADAAPPPPLVMTDPVVEDRGIDEPTSASDTPEADVPEGPVVHVDEATPVLAVKSPVQPLDMGAPISVPHTAPRVRTDIAASAVSGSAASLTPPGGSVKVRRGGSIAGTAMIFGLVFLLTVGIAVLVWTLLPLAPGSTSQTLPPTQSGEAELVEPKVDIAAAPAVVPDVTPEPEVTTTEETAAVQDVTPETPAQVETVEIVEPEVPDAPQPTPQTEIAMLEPPETGSAPRLAEQSVAVVEKAAPRSLAFLATDALPDYDANAPLPMSPAALANIAVTAPFPGPEPDIAETTDDIYIASIESSDLASDAIALPSVFGLTADDLPLVSGAPSTEAVAPQPDVAIIDKPDTLQPSQETDDAMAAAVAEALADALAGPSGLVPTKLASAIPNSTPRPRPGGFVEDIERDQFGGRTRNELAGLRPPPRPTSAQAEAVETPAPPSELAIATSLAPRGRPGDFQARVRAALVQREAERLSASVNTRAPDTSSAVEAALETAPTRPSQPQRLNIPTTASVARQATIENAIRLNKVNLVGVYGAVSDRRALVRLPSGRYVKVKVGDRVDGGTVAQITDSELLYRKGNRTLSLSMPKG